LAGQTALIAVDGWRLLTDPTFDDPAFANDLPRKTAMVLAAVQRPIAFSALVTPSGTPAWETIPSWYFVALWIASCRRLHSASWPSARMPRPSRSASHLRWSRVLVP
jgi:hypothetical protein